MINKSVRIYVTQFETDGVRVRNITLNGRAFCLRAKALLIDRYDKTSGARQFHRAE
jgi:hypothetical protein